MEFQMTWLKFIKVSIILFFSSKTFAYSLYNSCEYEYSNRQIVLCSPRELSESEIHSIVLPKIRTEMAYADFLKSKNIHWKPHGRPVTIYIIPLETLNNKKFFSKPPNSTLLGRYLPESRKLYTYFGSLETERAHEFAHYCNEYMNFSIEDDERLATEFEQFYTNYYDL